MTTSKDSRILSVIHSVCCGLDVHKKVIVATLISSNDSGQDVSHTMEFGTFTDDLVKLRSWLLEHECLIVAMESTGIYWRCVHNVLEADFEVILVNAGHVKNVPGRKTDIGDSRWLAGLLRHGLLRGSFIPAKEIRQWRELSRVRRKNRDTIGDYKRRVHKLFETANIKIDSMGSDLFGVTGRNLIMLLMTGPKEIRIEDIELCAKGSLQGKVNELHRSIQGFYEEHHRFQLTSLMQVIEALEKANGSIDARMRKLMQEHNDLIHRMDEVPGINELSAQYVLSELGPDLETFTHASALASWAGLCQGNNESAGKRRSERSPVRKHHLKTIMIEVAWAAVKKKGTYYRDKYWRLRYRLGPKKAIVAIAHRTLKALFFIIKRGEEYRELGNRYLTAKSQKNKPTRIRRDAEELGFSLIPIVAG